MKLSRALPVLFILPLAAAAPAGAIDASPSPGRDCAAGVASAYARANALPPTPGRAALLEQIQRAQIAHHEDDDDECRDQLRIATDVLDRIDASRRGAAPPR